MFFVSLVLQFILKIRFCNKCIGFLYSQKYLYRNTVSRKFPRAKYTKKHPKMALNPGLPQTKIEHKKIQPNLATEAAKFNEGLYEALKVIKESS